MSLLEKKINDRTYEKMKVVTSEFLPNLMEIGLKTSLYSKKLHALRFKP